jgi:hypothetical protein
MSARHRIRSVDRSTTHTGGWGRGGPADGPPPTEGTEMPLYMDIHRLGDGVTLDAVATAHARDLEIQDRYGVDYRHYWVDEDEGNVFCLVEAPDADTAATVHREAHGLVADEIHEVLEGH